MPSSQTSQYTKCSPNPLSPVFAQLEEAKTWLILELPHWWMPIRTFSPNSQPEGSLYWGASCDAKRLPLIRGAAMRKARSDDEESMFDGGRSPMWVRFPDGNSLKNK